MYWTIAAIMLIVIALCIVTILWAASAIVSIYNVIFDDGDYIGDDDPEQVR